MKRLRKRLTGNTLIDDPTIEFKEQALTNDIEQNETFMKHAFHKCSDLVCRQIRYQEDTPKRLIVYLGTLVDEKKVSEQIVMPLASDQQDRFFEKRS